MQSLLEIRRACERLRRLPEARWQQPPLPPLGARTPAAPTKQGPTLEQIVRDAIARIMHADAKARGVQVFTPDVPVFGLADVLEALAVSALESGDPDAARAVESVRRESREW